MQQKSQAPELALLRLHDVQRLTGLSRSSIFRLSAAGALPAPLKIGLRAIAWRSDEVADWIALRTRARADAAVGRSAKQ